MVIYAWARDATAANDPKRTRRRRLRERRPARDAAIRRRLRLLRSASGRRGPQVISRLVDASMSFGAPSIASPFAEEIFYARLRSARPSAPLPSGAAWAPDGATQPSPEWLPAIHEATVVELGAQVHLVSFAPGRLSFRIRAGAKEIVSAKGGAALPTQLDDAEQSRALAAIGLGAGRRKSPRGLVVGGEIGLPLKGDGGLLVWDSANSRDKDRSFGRSAPRRRRRDRAPSHRRRIEAAPRCA